MVYIIVCTSPDGMEIHRVFNSQKKAIDFLVKSKSYSWDKTQKMWIYDGCEDDIVSIEKHKVN